MELKTLKPEDFEVKTDTGITEAIIVLREWNKSSKKGGTNCSTD